MSDKRVASLVFAKYSLCKTVHINFVIIVGFRFLATDLDNVLGLGTHVLGLGFSIPSP